MHIMTSHHYRYQRAYFFQPIESYWKDCQTEVLNSLKGKPLIVYLEMADVTPPDFNRVLYVVMDTETKLILHSETLKRSEVKLN